MGLGRNLTLKYSLKKCFFNPHLRIYLLIRERERETSTGCPNQGSNPQTRYVP